MVSTVTNYERCPIPGSTISRFVLDLDGIEVDIMPARQNLGYELALGCKVVFGDAGEAPDIHCGCGSFHMPLEDIYVIFY